MGGEKVGRYSFLAADPFFEIEAYGQRVTTNAYPAFRRPDATLVTRQFESRRSAGRVCASESRRFAPAILPELPPFCSGAVGYAGYDTVRYFERLPNAPPDDRQVPDLAFAFYDQMVVFDNVNKTIVVVAMARLDQPGGDAASGLRRRPAGASTRLVEQLASAGGRAAAGRHPMPAAKSTLAYRSNFTQRAVRGGGARSASSTSAPATSSRSCSASGWKCRSTAHPFEIYRTLRVVNPSPFMFYLRTPSVTLVGSSPEIMVRVVDGQVTVRPLAGTRRRGATEEEDRRLAEELLADPKERAEHVMLVDLGRNDVGRVCPLPHASK